MARGKIVLEGNVVSASGETVSLVYLARPGATEGEDITDVDVSVPVLTDGLEGEASFRLAQAAMTTVAANEGEGTDIELRLRMRQGTGLRMSKRVPEELPPTVNRTVIGVYRAQPMVLNTDGTVSPQSGKDVPGAEDGDVLVVRANSQDGSGLPFVLSQPSTVFARARALNATRQPGEYAYAVQDGSLVGITSEGGVALLSRDYKPRASVLDGMPLLRVPQGMTVEQSVAALRDQGDDPFILVGATPDLMVGVAPEASTSNDGVLDDSLAEIEASFRSLWAAVANARPGDGSGLGGSGVGLLKEALDLLARSADLVADLIEDDQGDDEVARAVLGVVAEFDKIMLRDQQAQDARARAKDKREDDLVFERAPREW